MEIERRTILLKPKDMVSIDEKVKQKNEKQLEDDSVCLTSAYQKKDCNDDAKILLLYNDKQTSRICDSDSGEKDWCSCIHLLLSATFSRYRSDQKKDLYDFKL